MYPPPTPIPLVFFDSVFTVFSSLPSQSTRHALSVFCSPIHKPSCVAAIALGKPSGLLKSVFVFAFRTVMGGAPPPPVCARASRVPSSPTPSVARNSRRLVSMATLLRTLLYCRRLIKKTAKLAEFAEKSLLCALSALCGCFLSALFLQRRCGGGAVGLVSFDRRRRQRRRPPRVGPRPFGLPVVPQPRRRRRRPSRGRGAADAAGSAGGPRARPGRH